MTDPRLARLVAIGALLRDHGLDRLRQAAAARADTQARLAALSAEGARTAAPEVAPMAAARQALAYQAWADTRRIELNLSLARDTAAWIEARDAAARAVGRADVLRRLAGRG